MTTTARRRVTGAPIVRRPSLPLTAQDEQDLRLLREDTPQRQALVRLSGSPVEGATEAVMLRALLKVALERVEEEALAEGYAELAGTIDLHESRLVARRRRPQWATEDDA